MREVVWSYHVACDQKLQAFVMSKWGQRYVWRCWCDCRKRVVREAFALIRFVASDLLWWLCDMRRKVVGNAFLLREFVSGTFDGESLVVWQRMAEMHLDLGNVCQSCVMVMMWPSALSQFGANDGYLAGYYCWDSYTLLWKQIKHLRI